MASALAGVTLSGTAVEAAAAGHRVACELSVTQKALGPVEGRLQLKLVLRNLERKPLRVLTWGTPFEGAWWQPFVRLTRNGQEVPYQGATVKRGDPVAEDYLRLPAAGIRRAALPLQPAFDVSVPGRYRVEPRIVLHDVRGLLPAALPGRDALQPLPLDCPAVEFTVGS